MTKKDLEYQRKKGFIWIWALVGFLLFAPFGHFVMVPQIKGLLFSRYDRSGIKEICDEMFGDIEFSDILTKEIFLVAYDY